MVDRFLQRLRIVLAPLEVRLGIAVGLVLALLAAIVLVIDVISGRAGRISWIRFIVVAAAALLSLLNIFVHSRDAWTSVVPEGIWLSAIVIAVSRFPSVRR